MGKCGAIYVVPAAVVIDALKAVGAIPKTGTTYEALELEIHVKVHHPALPHVPEATRYPHLRAFEKYDDEE